MRTFLKNSAIVLALAGTAFVTAATAGADGLFLGFEGDCCDRYGTVVSVGEVREQDFDLFAFAAGLKIFGRIA